MVDLPRHVAGPGMPDTALGVVRAAGWRIEHDRHGNTFAFAPDRRVISAFLPEGDRFSPMITNWPSWEPVWVIRAYVHGELNQVIWEATFTSDTPAEFIAAFLLDLVRKTPLDNDRDEPAPPPLVDQ
ncbi:DUF317 domain-containing protein [Actinomadura sp. 6K520]|uniref:DUF317 domain-containing protein n=1 Tax=Actinomadura sp. 6K520 TaxID=2530364 RepID=UPI00104A2DBB|nr:DUF317 domain-containing protein [Actinomadura sp. 6K520]TDE22822.1 DUF317 domain-containing protein [Actinomadura sp. 6K520]